MPTPDEVKTAVKTFILEEFLSGENPDELTDEVEMMTLGILDSVAILKLVDFLEKRFNVSVHPKELDKDHLNTLNDIARTVCSKG